MSRLQGQIDRLSRLPRPSALVWGDLPDQPAEASKVPSRQRLAVAVIIGAIAAVFAYHQLTGRGWLASDLNSICEQRGAYLRDSTHITIPQVGPGSPYPFDAQFPYRIFAALFAVPFTVLTSYAAGAFYVGLISALMAYAVTRAGWWRLTLFLSPCYFVAASVANWSPLLLATAFLPLLYPLAMVRNPRYTRHGELPKPVGVPIRAVVFALSVLSSPATWPIHWLQSLAGQK